MANNGQGGMLNNQAGVYQANAGAANGNGAAANQMMQMGYMGDGQNAQFMMGGQNGQMANGEHAPGAPQNMAGGANPM